MWGHTAGFSVVTFFLLTVAVTCQAQSTLRRNMSVSTAEACKDAVVHTIRQEVLPELKKLVSAPSSDKPSGQCNETVPSDTRLASDCSGITTLRSGVYTLYTHVAGKVVPYQAYCDMETDRGGWTVIQRRQDGSENFNRPWADYVNGFGSVGREFWLGLRLITDLTQSQEYHLRVEVQNFSGDKQEAIFNNFYLNPGRNDYSLYVRYFYGSAGYAVARNNGQAFSAPSGGVGRFQCAQPLKGGWWYYISGNRCIGSNLNGEYLGKESCCNRTDFRGIRWSSAFGGASDSLAFTEMKIRPAKF